MKKTHLTITASVVLLVLLTVFAFRPVNDYNEKDCRSIKGKVTDVFRGGAKDVVFLLEGHKENFYIDNGLQKGIDPAVLEKELVDKEVTIKYPDNWSVLNMGKSTKHIIAIEHSGKIIFKEANK